MEKIRFYIYVLLCSAFLMQVNFANGSDLKDCPTSPIRDEKNKENIMDVIHGTTPVDHGTTPVDLAGSLRKFPSCPSCNDLFQRAASQSFSTDDLALLAAVVHSPRKKCPLSYISANTLHGTTPVK